MLEGFPHLLRVLAVALLAKVTLKSPGSGQRALLDRDSKRSVARDLMELVPPPTRSERALP